MKNFKTVYAAFLAVVLSVFFAACGDSNSASTDQHEHFEAEGWNLYWGDWQLADNLFDADVRNHLSRLKSVIPEKGRNFSALAKIEL